MTYGEPCRCEKYSASIGSFVSAIKLYCVAENTLNRVRDLCADCETAHTPVQTTDLRAALKPLEPAQ